MNLGNAGPSCFEDFLENMEWIHVFQQNFYCSVVTWIVHYFCKSSGLWNNSSWMTWNFRNVSGCLILIVQVSCIIVKMPVWTGLLWIWWCRKLFIIIFCSSFSVVMSAIHRFISFISTDMWLTWCGFLQLPLHLCLDAWLLDTHALEFVGGNLLPTVHLAPILKSMAYAIPSMSAKWDCG